MKYRLFLLASLFMFLVSCVRNWNNPWDPESPNYGPNITITIDGDEIEPGTGTYSFSSTMLGIATEETFTLRNSGPETLNLTGTPRVELSGTDASLFRVVAEPSASLDPDSSTEFSLEFLPTDTTGQKSAFIAIASNDPNQSEFQFSVSGDASEWYGSKVITAPGGYGISMTAYDDIIYVTYFISFTTASVGFARSTDLGITWETQTLTGDLGYSYENGISIGASDAGVFISYYDNSNNDLMLLKSNDGWTGWTITTIDSAGSVGTNNSIAVSGNYVFIAYYDYTNGDLDLARSYDAGSTWSLSTIDSVGSVGMYVDVATEGEIVNVSYSDDTNEALKYARSNDAGTSWNTHTVESTAYVSGPTSIGLSATSVYICYIDYVSDTLNLAYSDGGTTWNTRIVDSTDSNKRNSSMTVYGSNIYIGYFDSDNNNLKFAFSTSGGTTWSIDALYSNIITGYTTYTSSTSLSTSNLFICYHNSTVGDLRIIRSLDGGVTW